MGMKLGLASASLAVMQRLVLAAIGVAMLAGLQTAPPVPSDARAGELIRALNLEVLPRESGYLGIIGRSAADCYCGRPYVGGAKPELLHAHA